MQEWTRWFREQQEAVGTVEDFARKAGLDVRSVSAYRNGRIPKGKAIAKITAAVGNAGPLPGAPSKRIVTLEERVAFLERIVFSRASAEEIQAVEAELDRLEREGPDAPEAGAGQSPAG